MNCPHCTRPFAHLRLPGHYSGEVELDHCDACRLLWFDERELAQLGRRGWALLLQRLVIEARARSEATPPTPAAQPPCPRCTAPLKASHNQTIYGRFVGLACGRGHGSAQRDAALFAARGLFRPPLPGEQAGPHCLGCGAPAQPGERRERGNCRWCDTPPLVVDLPRLMQSLGLRERGGTFGQGQALRWACVGCGQSLDLSRDARCAACGQGLIAQQLPALEPLIEQALALPPAAPLKSAATPLARGTEAEVWRALAASQRSAFEPGAPRSGLWRLLAWLARVLMQR